MTGSVDTLGAQTARAVQSIPYVVAQPTDMMGLKERYENGKHKLLTDLDICESNRDLFCRFLQFEERKLKRMNGLATLDKSSLATLYTYLHRLRNVNSWFQNKPWADLTKDDIQRVYDGLEDGTIVNARGVRFGDRRGYYNKILKSKPFQLAGKRELAREVIEFATQEHKDVRFLTEESFRSLASVVSKPIHLLLLWLAWDVGENINTLLQLTRSDFNRQLNADSGEPEYVVNLPYGKLKRSRTPRSEPTLYPETAQYADLVLKDMAPTDRVFRFGYRQAWKLLRGAVTRAEARVQPTDDLVRWKDLRSGMACHLLRSGWTCDEVNARLGHAPHSKELDAYINFLAIDRSRPKKRLLEASVHSAQRKLRQSVQRETLMRHRVQRQSEENTLMRSELEAIRSDLGDLRREIGRLLPRLGN